MIKKFFIFLSLVFVFFSSVPFCVAEDYGLGTSAQFSGYKESDNVYTFLKTIINITLSVLAIVFFGLMLFAGLRWMTARGNEEFTKKAKSILEGAIIGLVIVLAAYGVTTFFFGRFGIK
jgi:hypothetical protein